MNSIEMVINFLQDKWYLVLVVAGVTIWRYAGSEVDKELSSKKCEYCVAAIAFEARTCRYCGKDQLNSTPISIAGENSARMQEMKFRDSWSWKENRIPYVLLLLLLLVFLALSLFN